MNLSIVIIVNIIFSMMVGLYTESVWGAVIMFPVQLAAIVILSFIECQLGWQMIVIGCIPLMIIGIYDLARDSKRDSNESNRSKSDYL